MDKTAEFANAEQDDAKETTLSIVVAFPASRLIGLVPVVVQGRPDPFVVVRLGVVRPILGNYRTV